MSACLLFLFHDVFWLSAGLNKKNTSVVVVVAFVVCFNFVARSPINPLSVSSRDVFVQQQQQPPSESTTVTPTATEFHPPQSGVGDGLQDVCFFTMVSAMRCVDCLSGGWQ